MRNILIIALREVHQAVNTRGFWIGILILPLMGLLIFGVMRLSQSASSVKYFVLVDQTGQFEEIIKRDLEKEYQRNVMRSLQGYVQKYVSSRDERSEGSMENIPASIREAQPEITDVEIEQFIESGGQEHVLKSVAQLLRADSPDFEMPRRIYPYIDLPAGISASESLESISEKLRPYFNGEKKLIFEGEPVSLFAAVLIPKDFSVRSEIISNGLSPKTKSHIQYWSKNLADNDLQTAVESTLTDQIRRDAFMSVGVGGDVYKRITNQTVHMKNFNPTNEKGKEEVSLADRIRQWAPAGLTYLLWMYLFGILNALLTSTIEEKSNRIIEVLLSSVTPSELMLGKLTGVAVSGLISATTQIALGVGILYFFAGPEAVFINQLLEVLTSSHLLPAFFAYFILGYIIYGGLFIAIGGLCDTITDAQGYMGPLMLLMMIPLFTMAIIPRDPNGMLAVVMSWFPLYTPFAMINRIAADPPLIEVIGTLILLLVSSAFILWASGKIFRIAILRTGQPPKIKELVKWIRGYEASHSMDENK